VHNTCKKKKSGYTVSSDNKINGDNNMKTRQQERHETTMTEIKTIAWQLMAERGGAGLSLREISRQMRMSSAAIYRYFPNRDALLEQLTLDAYQSLAEMLEQHLAVSKDVPISRKISEFAVTYRRWAILNPVKYILIYDALVPGYAPNWEHLIPAARRPLDGFIHLMAEAEKAGLLPSSTGIESFPRSLNQQLQELIDSRAYAVSAQGLFIALAGWTTVHGLVSLELSGQLYLLGENTEAFFTAEIQRFIHLFKEHESSDKGNP
jgi:AcrR family transcriptional regulator